MLSILNTAILVATLASVWHIGKKLMATQAELAANLRALKAQNDKATDEQNAALAALQAALDAAGGTTPAVDEAMAALTASIQRDDDLNLDAPAPAPAPAPQEPPSEPV